MMTNTALSPQCALVTGANGFVGSHVIDALLKNGCSVKAVVRNAWSNAPQGIEVLVADLSLPVDWSDALCGVTTIIHLAARVHKIDKSPQKVLDEFRSINTRATLELAEQAAKAGVKRFIYLSSVAVNGTFTAPGEYFTEQSEPRPISPYAISKYESELGLQKLAQQFAMEYVIIRPPMVYGVKAPGNFSRLVSLVETGIPLPFKLVKNPRSFIFIENLVSFVLACVEHKAAGNELFLVSDGEDLSLSDLVFQISKNLKCGVTVWPVPTSFLKLFLKFLGRGGMVNQILKPMRINNGRALTILGWRPLYSATAAINLSVKKRECR
jgi:nucleoside-diphosphate-sugar epimerase